jgi:MG2 domain-containing protein
MSTKEKRKHQIGGTLVLLVAASLFSAAAASALSSMIAFAQPSIGSDQGKEKGNVNATANIGGGNASAQGNMTASQNSDASAAASYKPSYPKERADEKRPFSVHTEKHLYKAGEEVEIEGSIWSSLIDQIGGNVRTVKLNVTDNKGNMTILQKEADVNDDGGFTTTFTLPQNAELGSYSVDATIEVNATVIDTLNADVKSKLETTARFELVSSTAFAVKAQDGKSFNLEIASNSTVTAPEFKQEEKKISFHVEGQTGTRGVTDITIPKALLGGQITVSIDGKVIPGESSDVVIIADTEEGMTLEINYHHSEHTIEVIGTNVVPEFPLAMIVMAAAISSVIAAATGMARKRSSLL